MPQESRSTDSTEPLPGFFSSMGMTGWLLTFAVVFALLIAVFFMEENWRGKRAWEKYRKAAEARGVVFDFKKFVPPEVPDSQNFAETPLLAPLFDFAPGHSAWRDSQGLARAQAFPTNFNWGTPAEQVQFAIASGRFTDFDELTRNLWKRAKNKNPLPAHEDAARTILDNLKQYQPDLDELRTASHLPCARFNISYDDEQPEGILLPHLAVLKRVAVLLQIKASAELALGKTDDAFDDLKFMKFLTKTIQGEPFLISHLVRFAMLRLSRQVVWEGLARGRWSDAQLQEIQSGLHDLNLMKDTRYSLESERAAYGVILVDYIRNNPRGNSSYGGLFSFVPSGWLYFEQISYQRAFDEQVLPGLNANANRVDPAQIDRNFASLKAPEGSGALSGRDSVAKLLLHHDILKTLLVPPLGHVYQKAAVAQTAVNEALIACALERYHLANGKLPATLDALVPQFLDHVPPDICNGQPLVYRPGTANQFVLYSVGWNETDDGGTTVMGRGSTPTPDSSKGDWVWPPYPAK